MKVLSVVVLADCSGAQQTLLASGGADDFQQMAPIRADFGDGPPDVMLTLTIGEQEKPFKIWLSKIKPRIMVLNGLLGNRGRRLYARARDGNRQERSARESTLPAGSGEGPDGTASWLSPRRLRFRYPHRLPVGIHL